MHAGMKYVDAKESASVKFMIWKYIWLFKEASMAGIETMRGKVVGSEIREVSGVSL